MVHTPVERLAARRSLIEMMRRRQQPGTGSAVPAKIDAKRSAMHWWKDIERPLAPIPHAVVAADLYMRPRQTADLDIALGTTDLEAAEAKLTNAGASRIGPLRLGGGLEGGAWRDPAKGTKSI
jgi:hypothetical protein